MPVGGANLFKENVSKNVAKGFGGSVQITSPWGMMLNNGGITNTQFNQDSNLEYGA